MVKVFPEDSGRGQPLSVFQKAEVELLVMEFSSSEKREETLALLKLLTIGEQERAAGRCKDAGEFFADLDRDDAA